MRRLISLVVVLAVLVAAYLIVKSQRNKAVAPERITNFLKLSRADIDRFEIRKGSETTLCRLIEGRWYVIIDSIPRLADTTSINQVIKMATALEVSGVESENPQMQGQLGVDSAGGTALFFFAGERPLNSVIIGRSAQGYDYAYIRQPQSNKVYRARGVVSYAISKPAINWRDKTILVVDTGTLSTLEFAYGDQIFSLVRADTIWNVRGEGLPAEAVADRDSIEVYKRLLANLRTDDFYKDVDTLPVDFEKPELVLTISFTSGFKERLLVFGAPENTSRYYVRKDGLDETFVFYKSKYAQLTRRLNNFIPDAKNG